MALSVPVGGALAAAAALAVTAVVLCAANPIVQRDANPPAPGFDAEHSDPAAIALADSVMERLGGRAAWDATRYVSWNFFGSRRHVWDRYTGDVRVEGRTEQDKPYVVLVNIETGAGKVRIEGEEVVDVAVWLERGKKAWINDSYWLFMPYKLKDSGVTLRHRGARRTVAGDEADVVELTFEGVGVTPENRYEVYVGRTSGLVEQWDFYRNRADAEPGFRIPWRGWQAYGHTRIMLSGDRGEGRTISQISVHETLPRSVFEDLAPVQLQ